MKPQFPTILILLLNVCLLGACQNQYRGNPNDLMSVTDHKTKNVFLITLDGLRWQELFNGADAKLVANQKFVRDTTELKKLFWNEDPMLRRKVLMPFFWSTIASNGQIYGNRKFENNMNCKNPHWFSYPGYNEILTGLVDSTINSNDKVYNKNQTVLEFLNQKKQFHGKIGAFASWDVFPYIINDQRSGIPVNAGFRESEDEARTPNENLLNELQKLIPSHWSTVRHDAFTHYYAMEYIKREMPRVLYIAYGETDDFAHDGDYEQYLTSANRTDGFIQELWEYVQNNEFYKDQTTFLITTDHGRGDVVKEEWTSHGSDVVGGDEIWMAVIGPDTDSSGEQKTSIQLYQDQVAATLTSFLGIDYTLGKQYGEVIREVIIDN